MKTLRRLSTAQWLLIAAVIIALGGGVYLAAHSSKTSTTVNNQPGSSTSGSGNGITSSGKEPGSGGSTDTTTPPTASNPPAIPQGQFVSAHQVPLAAPVESVCATSAGASCQITFTKDDGTMKSLPAQTTDSNGNTHWSWTVSTYLTAGTWTIKAVATQSNMTSTATDATKLVVTP